MTDNFLRQRPEEAEHPADIPLAILGRPEGDIKIQPSLHDISGGTDIVKNLLPEYQRLEQAIP